MVSTKLEVNKPFVTKEPALGISFQYQQRDQAMGHWNLSIFPGKAKVLPEVLLFCYTVDSSAPADQTTLILHTNGPRGSFPWETGLHLYCSDFCSKLLENIPLDSQLSGFSGPKSQSPSIVLPKPWSGLSQQFCYAGTNSYLRVSISAMKHEDQKQVGEETVF